MRNGLYAIISPPLKRLSEQKSIGIIILNENRIDGMISQQNVGNLLIPKRFFLRIQ